MDKLCQVGTSIEEFENAINTYQVDVNENFGDDNKTALKWAATGNKDNIVSLLIEKGANIDFQDKFGRSTLTILV